MGNANIDELKIEFPEGMKISMKKNAEKEVVFTNGSQSQTDTTINEATNKEKTQEDIYKIIKSPMVGTFYSRPAPNKEAFAKAGDTVKKGQVICIVEAMKLMNEIESEFDGEIAEICVKDGDVVEYGTPLFKIK